MRWGGFEVAGVELLGERVERRGFADKVVDVEYGFRTEGRASGTAMWGRGRGGRTYYGSCGGEARWGQTCTGGSERSTAMGTYVVLFEVGVEACLWGAKVGTASEREDRVSWVGETLLSPSLSPTHMPAEVLIPAPACQ